MSQAFVAVNGIWVHENIYEGYLKATIKAVAAMSVSEESFEALWTLGPIQNSVQYEKVKGLLKETAAKGLKLALGSGTVEEC